MGWYQDLRLRLADFLERSVTAIEQDVNLDPHYSPFLGLHDTWRFSNIRTKRTTDRTENH